MRGFGSKRPPGIPDDMRVRGPRPGDRPRVPAVYVVPPWIGNPSWGSKTDQSGLPPNGKFLTLAECKTEDESTQVFTVTIQSAVLVNSKESGINLGGPVSALVEFGTAGGDFQVVVDVWQGTQFSLAASWIRVSVINEAFLNPNAASQVPVQASASISMLPTTKNEPVTKTVMATAIAGVGAGAPGSILGFLDTPVPAGSGITLLVQEIISPFSPKNCLFMIPYFAKSVILQCSRVGGATPGSRRIEFLDANGGFISIYPFVVGEKQFDPAQIPAGTIQIRFFNDDANPQTFLPQFFLDM